MKLFIVTSGKNNFDIMDVLRADTKEVSTKLSKSPLYTGWIKITEEKSAELASKATHRNGPLIYLTSETTNRFIVELDKKDPLRRNHKQQTEYWTQNFEEPDNTNTLVLKMFNEGYHLIYKYEKGVNSEDLIHEVLTDLLSDDRGMVFL